MKKRILSLLMIMVMVFGIGVVSHAEADEVQYYEGVLRVYIDGYGEEGVPVNGYYMDGQMVSIFNTISGYNFKLKANTREIGEASWDIQLLINGSEVATNGTCYMYQDKSFSIGFKWGGGEGELNYAINGELYLTDEPTIHEISTPFTGTAVSDRGEYTLALAGYFEKELADGTHELTLEEIKEQTISVVAYNKANGVKRVMTQSTIEEMSVTVSGGVVTEYTIRGRVQTTGGKLDRYTAVISN